MSRHTWRGFFYLARCRGCDWTTGGRNGLGLAAQHHDRTGHSVNVDVEGTVSYLNEADNAERLREKAGGYHKSSEAV